MAFEMLITCVNSVCMERGENRQAASFVYTVLSSFASLSQFNPLSLGCLDQGPSTPSPWPNPGLQGLRGWAIVELEAGTQLPSGRVLRHQLGEAWTSVYGGKAFWPEKIHLQVARRRESP